MDLPPLPPCPQAIDRSLPDADWNRHNKHWLPATVWIAQHTARQASHGCADSSEGLQRCAGCAADLTLCEKPKCSRCKLVRPHCWATVSTTQMRSSLMFLLHRCIFATKTASAKHTQYTNMLAVPPTEQSYLRERLRYMSSCYSKGLCLPYAYGQRQLYHIFAPSSAKVEQAHEAVML